MSVRPRLAVLAVFAAGGAAFGGYYLWPSGRQLATCVHGHAVVPADARQALAAYAGRIRHAVERMSDGTRDESWSDAVTGQNRQLSFDSSGRATSEFAIVPSGSFERTITVTFDAHVWMSDRHRALSRSRDPNAAATSAQANRDRVAQGRAVVVGRENVDGRTTLQLRELVHLPHRTFPTPALLRFDTWVDPLTYLTVRTRTDAGRDRWSVNDESWLPRTPANLARTKPLIPAGFRRIFPEQHSFDMVLRAKTPACR
jgi:hypothetical protein